MSIIIQNAVHAHTYSAPVFLLGVKLSPLPVCALHLQQNLAERKQNWSVADSTYLY